MKKIVLFILGALILTSCATQRMGTQNVLTQTSVEYHTTPEMENLNINGIVYIITIDREVDARTGISTLRTQYRSVYDFYNNRILDEITKEPAGAIKL